MENPATYDLRYELKNASLDANDSSRLITPSGFRMQACDSDREILEFCDPGGNLLPISRWLTFTDHDNPRLGGIWTYVAPLDASAFKVAPLELDYDLAIFIHDLVEKFVMLGNQLRPDWQPFKITWES